MVDETKLEWRAHGICAALGALIGVPLVLPLLGSAERFLVRLLAGALALCSARQSSTLLITDSRNTLSLLLIAAALVGIPLFIFVFWGVGK